MADIDMNAKKSVEALTILETASEETPSFLRGVLLSPQQAQDLKFLLEQLNCDEVDAKKYWNGVQKSIKQSERFVGDVLTGLLEGGDVRDVTIRAMARKGESV